MVIKEMTTPKLTVGIAVYKDFNGLWPTIQSLKIHHAECINDIELVVIDNEPGKSKNSENSQILASRWNGPHKPKYVKFIDVEGTAAAKEQVFKHATGDAVLVLDSHVMLPTGVLHRLIDFYGKNPTTNDLYQGPCLADEVTKKDGSPQFVGSHFSPGFRGFMDGQWALDERAYGDAPFEIPMQGMWLFSCRREAWVGFHSLTRGFDASEQGYIHAKFRKLGRKCWCLPWLTSVHRFGPPVEGIPYKWNDRDRVYCYIQSWLDVQYPQIAAIKKHFTEDVQAIDTRIGRRIDSAYFDEIYQDAMSDWSRIQQAPVIGGPCRFRSELPKRVDKCDTCGERGNPVDVYHCAHPIIAGECTLQRAKNSVRSCGICQRLGEDQYEDLELVAKTPDGRVSLPNVQEA